MNATLTVIGPFAAPRELAPTIDHGTTAFMFLATSMVQFMTPGLAFFYSGMVPETSTIMVMYQSFVCLGLIFLMWTVFVFSLTFGEPMLTIGGYNLLARPDTFFMLTNVGIYAPLQRASTIVVNGFPGMLFMAYQGMFAVITPALISGAFVDRMRFGPYLIFISIWIIVVYAPLGFWNWGGGWMFQIGAWDFAGGMVVHEAAGFSSLAAMVVLGERKNQREAAPHSLPLVLLGTGMLWFGWFGFNGGSALAIGGLATIAFVNTQIAPSAAMVTWIGLDWLWTGKPTMLGACSGAICGLVVITPSAGFVQPQMAIVAGVVGSIVCYFCVEFVKKTPLDDTCDTLGVHGMGGFLGTILVGVLSDSVECSDKDDAPDWCANPGTVYRSFTQIYIQTICAVASACYAFMVTYVLCKIMLYVRPNSQSEEQQARTKDIPSFGEVAYQGVRLGNAIEGSDDEEPSEVGTQELHKALSNGNAKAWSLQTMPAQRAAV